MKVRTGLKVLAAAFAAFTAIACQGGNMPVPPDPDKDAFDGTAAWDDIVKLSSDVHTGRLPGTPGNAKAAEFIEKRLAALGYETSRQAFTLKVPFYKGVPTLQVVAEGEAAGREFAFRDEFSESVFNAAGGKALGVFRVVAYVEAVAGNAGPYVILLPEEYDTIKDDIIVKDAALVAAGVETILYFSTPETVRRRTVATGSGDPTAASADAAPGGAGAGEVPKKLVKVALSTTVMDEILEFAAGNAAFRVNMSWELAEVSTWNVVGRLSAPKEGGEAPVYVTAHYDHLGRDEQEDRIFNGALDNASGVAAMLEMARLVAERREGLRRDFVVVAFSGEEEGMLGAGAYAKDPVWPLEGACVINIDMIGSRIRVDAMAMSLGPGDPCQELVLRALRFRTVRVDPVLGERSDHGPLARAGAAAVSVIEYSGEHYHEKTDDPDVTVDRRRLDLMGGAIADAVLSLLMKER